MKQLFQSLIPVVAFILCATSLLGQDMKKNNKGKVLEIDFSDRKAIIETIENFYIGDHTGSITHKKSSMHEKGAYRYVNKDGEYKESAFRLDSDNADPNYKEELLSIEIYDKLALARLRLKQFRTEIPEYKLMTLHKVKGEWKITGITWGFGIKQ